MTSKNEKFAITFCKMDLNPTTSGIQECQMTLTNVTEKTSKMRSLMETIYITTNKKNDKKNPFLLTASPFTANGTMMRGFPMNGILQEIDITADETTKSPDSTNEGLRHLTDILKAKKINQK